MGKLKGPSAYSFATGFALTYISITILLKVLLNELEASEITSTNFVRLLLGNPKVSFWDGFAKSFSSIFLTEIGDKTFILTAILCSRYNPWSIFLGAQIGLALNHFISVFLGSVLTEIIPTYVTMGIAILLFFFFGIKMLWEAYKGEKEEVDESELNIINNGNQTKDNDIVAPAPGRKSLTEELAEQMKEQKRHSYEDLQLKLQQNLQKKRQSSGILLGSVMINVITNENDDNKPIVIAAEKTECNIDDNSCDIILTRNNHNVDTDVQNNQTKHTDDQVKKENKLPCYQRCLAKIGLANNVAVNVGLLMFLSEWGDRSQMTGMALGATSNIWGVAIGGFSAHLIAGILSLVCGMIISKFLNVRVLQIIGGLLFLGFGSYMIFEFIGEIKAA